VTWRLQLLFVLILAPAVRAAEDSPPIWPFFENHCVECHDDSTAKGGLDLYEAIENTIAGKKSVQRWTEIFDRVDHDEMPPPKKPRPAAEEKAAFLDWIRPRLIQADATEREVVHRRLNREEYENTVRDLLGIETDLKELLPEDQSAFGFDNNGGALAISAELIERYLEAARRAIDATLYEGPQPEVETFTASSLKEVTPYLGGHFARIDDHIFRFMRTRGNYSKISSRSRRTTHAGRYRVRFSARTVNSPTPITFSAVALNHQGIGGKSETVGYFEASEKPTFFEFEVNVEKGSYVQIFSHDLPVWVKNPSIDEHAAVGIGPFAWTGPLYESWPPPSHQNLLGDCDLETGTLEDAETVFRKFLPRAFRRPVTEAEIARPVALVKKAIDAGRPFSESLRVGLESILCSPNLLFLRETSHEQDRISDYELASRLSYFLWNSTPDQVLLDHAANGELSNPTHLSQEVERMLNHPKSDRFVENFTGQWLKLREINATTPDGKLYKEFDEVLQVSMIAESQAFFDHLLTENLPLTNFLDSDFAMLNRRLANHYGIDGVEGFAMQPVALPPGHVRGGVLTQGAVLKVTANGTNTSPVMRGVWVLENVLGKHIPPPPPNIEGIEPDIREATTIREKLDLHRNSESCASCHQYIDPPGFALESFDPIGSYRENYLQFKVNPKFADKGWGSVVKAKPVDASGQFATGEAFATFQEFRALLLEDSETFAACLTDRLATYALGREMGFSDREALHSIVSKTRAEGNGFRTLIHNLISSPLFSQP
tara:strand:+ start:3771 stop:6092 length:2322 start_codon:yes stop_codon:yes gene_type:complete